MERVLVDGGFRDGVYTEQYLRKHPQGTAVFAFEPYQMNRDKSGMLSLSYLKCVIIPIEKALWISDEPMYFYPATRIDGGSLIDGMKHKASTEPVKVQCMSIDRLFKDIRGAYPGLPVHVKLDIEGAEYAVINRMLDNKLLEPVDELVVEWHLRQNRSFQKTHEELIRRLEDNGVKYINWK